MKMDRYEYAGDPHSSGSGQNFLAQIPNILRDRKVWILTSLLIGLVASVAAALLIPLKYTSNATMLVEAPQLPTDVLDQGDVDIVDRRIARIRQRITSRPDLIAMIERHNLYAGRRGSESLTDLIEDMRESIEITPTVADTSRNGVTETIAFTLAFSYPEANAAQAVTQDLMERILQLDARGSVEQATNTVDFLEERAARLEEQIATLENQIITIKRGNGLSLSEGGMVISSGQGGYDVQIASLQRENQALIAQRRAAQGADTRDPLVVAAERDLAAKRAVYSDTHPDVLLARQRLAEVRELARANSSGQTDVSDLTRQIEFNNSQIAALQAAKAGDQRRLNSQMAAQARAPVLQQQIANLERRLVGYTEQYEAISEQLTSARTGVQAEDEQMTERLTVVEAPITPENPSSPNYLIIFGLGIVGGAVVGFALAFAVELFLKPIRDPHALEEILGVEPLGVIPHVDALDVGQSISTKKRSFLNFRKGTVRS